MDITKILLHDIIYETHNNAAKIFTMQHTIMQSRHYTQTISGMN